MCKLTIFILCELFLLTWSNENEFKPTKYWKKIEEGQKVPSGLHYRINMQTGYKEAKILDDTEKSQSNNNKNNQQELSVPYKENLESLANDLNEILNPEIKLEEMLKNIPSDKFEYSEDEIKKIKDKFKTYDKIKKEMSDLNMDIKLDYEIINGLVKKYTVNTTLTISEKLNILDELEYLVHQIDNAIQFLDAGGLDSIILVNLVNQTNANLRMKSLHLLGSLTQNNPQAQIFVFEKNIGDHLTKLLSSPHTIEDSILAVYAYGSLLRKFPFAQREILSKTGLIVLLNLLSETKDIKLKIKIITLLSDFVQESIDALHDFENNPNNEHLQEKLEQYKLVNFESYLKNSTYCEHIESMFRYDKINIISEYDYIEKIIDGCLVTEPLCHLYWSESPLVRHFLLVLKHRYENFVDSNDLDMKTLYESLIEKVNLMFNRLEFEEMQIRDEL